MYQLGMKSTNILGLEKAELIQLAEGLGERSFRGKQLYVQMYRRKILDFDAMTDLAKPFRETLKSRFCLRLPEVERRSESSDGTIKFLMRLVDGLFIETVYIPEENRDTLCISSQVGCDVGCTFCLTARMGFKRNLRADEIVGQVLRVIQEGHLEERGFNIVFMGMGEPLYNFKNVMKAFRILTDGDGMDLSHRKITISTSGIVPVLKRLALEPRIPNLAISLNATTDPVRSRIMPVNRKWSIEELLSALRDLPLEPRRRITIEYVLLAGENDSEADAVRLAGLLKGLPVKVNLIPYNPNPGLSHRRPTAQAVAAFQEALSKADIAGFVRKTRGDDVSAACGQLALLSSVQPNGEPVMAS